MEAREVECRNAVDNQFLKVSTMMDFIVESSSKTFPIKGCLFSLPKKCLMDTLNLSTDPLICDTMLSLLRSKNIHILPGKAVSSEGGAWGVLRDKEEIEGRGGRKLRSSHPR